MTVGFWKERATEVIGPYNRYRGEIPYLVKPAFAVLIEEPGLNVYRPRELLNTKCACPNQARDGQQVAGRT